MAEERPDPDFPTDGDVDAVLDEFKGDPRAAIRAILSDLATLAADYGEAVSWGYVRSGRPGSPIQRDRWQTRSR